MGAKAPTATPRGEKDMHDVWARAWIVIDDGVSCVKGVVASRLPFSLRVWILSARARGRMIEIRLIANRTNYENVRRCIFQI